MYIFVGRGFIRAKSGTHEYVSCRMGSLYVQKAEVLYAGNRVAYGFVRGPCVYHAVF